MTSRTVLLILGIVGGQGLLLALASCFCWFFVRLQPPYDVSLVPMRTLICAKYVSLKHGVLTFDLNFDGASIVQERNLCVEPGQEHPLWAIGVAGFRASATVVDSRTRDETGVPVLMRRILVVLPFWILSGVVAFVPLAFLLVKRTRRWWWAKKGCCLKCGYSLRGLPGPKCPECGTESQAGVVHSDSATEGGSAQVSNSQAR